MDERLTRDEQIRLCALDRAITIAPAAGIRSKEGLFKAAEEIEKWIKSAGLKQ